MVDVTVIVELIKVVMMKQMDVVEVMSGGVELVEAGVYRNSKGARIGKGYLLALSAEELELEVMKADRPEVGGVVIQSAQVMTGLVQESR